GRVQPVEAGAVHAQEPVAEAVLAVEGILLPNLCPEHVAIERVRPIPVVHRDHDVVDRARPHVTPASGGPPCRTAAPTRGARARGPSRPPWRGSPRRAPRVPTSHARASRPTTR